MITLIQYNTCLFLYNKKYKFIYIHNYININTQSCFRKCQQNKVKNILFQEAKCLFYEFVCYLAVLVYHILFN